MVNIARTWMRETGPSFYSECPKCRGIYGVSAVPGGGHVQTHCGGAVCERLGDTQRKRGELKNLQSLLHGG